MKTLNGFVRPLLTALSLSALAFAGAASAQSTSPSTPTLDRVIASKTLRCGIQLDFPPAGFRTPQNEPEGYDVAYCKDMAKALGATAQIVETPSAVRARLNVEAGQ